MNSIGDFLKKYLDFTPPSRARARAVARAISERFDTPLEESGVEVRGSRVYVRTNAALKSEIALHKAALIRRIRELGGGEVSELL